MNDKNSGTTVGLVTWFITITKHTSNGLNLISNKYYTASWNWSDENVDPEN